MITPRDWASSISSKPMPLEVYRMRSVREAGVKGQADLIDGAAVDIGAEVTDIP